MAVVPFPRRPLRVPIGGIRCEGCGGKPFIFAPGLRVQAWCSPFCAAEGGLMPWAACPESERARWPAPGAGRDGGAA